MKCLVVSAHPLTNSLCTLFTGQVTGQLESAGHHVMFEDLYAQDFAASLTAVERESYYAEYYDRSAVAGQIERLLAAEALVLVFPTWWFNFPAILKGWFDRVWVPGVAYDHGGDFGPIKPRLDNLKKVLVITTLGSAAWVDRLVMRRPVKRLVRYALLTPCAKHAKLKFLSLYGCENLKQQQLAKFNARIAQAVADL